ncbi:unnamed protein product [Coffea canephora]|uniref:Uncharacterized protein n=1 Tax=Coffea canephora TaxID=49390 RepID=A0A068USS9_COFCA|nr:unnamed protein product [Coffea canephora]
MRKLIYWFSIITSKTWIQLLSSDEKEEEENCSSNGRVEVETCRLVVVGNCKLEEVVEETCIYKLVVVEICKLEEVVETCTYTLVEVGTYILEEVVVVTCKLREEVVVTYTCRLEVAETCKLVAMGVNALEVVVRNNGKVVEVTCKLEEVVEVTCKLVVVTKLLSFL